MPNNISNDSLKNLLERKYEEYNSISFIENDPISIPHSFSNQSDIELSAFFSALLAWGSRIIILNKLNELMNRMNRQPFDFISNYKKTDFKYIKGFVHRTFNDSDLEYFVLQLKRLIAVQGSIKNSFIFSYKSENECIKAAINRFRRELFESAVINRAHKHFSDPFKNSACKRFNMFLRWMVRKDNKGVDFGIWNEIPASKLFLPLDLHSGRVARKLGLLTRKQDDWKAVEEITSVLRTYDPTDPIKYDYALFGMGVNQYL